MGRFLISFGLLVASVLACHVQAAHAQQFDWANEAGGLGLDAGRAVATDSEGNVVMVGSFSGVATFGDTVLYGLGGPDAFIGKYTPDGQQLWIRAISGPSEDLARGVTTDHLGNIFVTGHFTTSAFFLLNETDTVELVSEGRQDVFIAKYDASGELLWARRAGGTEDDTGADIVWHQDGKLLVSGGFQGRATFANVSMLATGLTDIFLLSLDGNGNALWVKRGGGPQHDVAASVAYDKVSGNIYITGDFFGSAVFGTTTIYAAGSSDMYLAKYDLTGELLWVTGNGSTNLDVATKVGCDLQGHVYVAGQYQGTTEFGSYTVTSRGYNDVFVAKFDGNGNVVWLRSMGGYNLETCQGMAVDWDGTTYTTGMYDSRLVCDQDTLEGEDYDIFITCLEPSGHTRYLKGAGAGSADIPMGICFGQGQSLFLTGFFYFFADFDNVTIGNALNGDIFLTRLTDIVGIDQPDAPKPSTCASFNAADKTIHLDCGLTGPWQVIDLSGKVIMQGSAHVSRVPLDGLPKGYYLFAMVGNARNGVLPFVAF